MQQVGLACFKQLLNLFPLNLPLQNNAPRTKVATTVRASRFFTGVGQLMFIDCGLTFRARPQSLLPRKINRFSILITIALTKIEFSLEFLG